MPQNNKRNRIERIHPAVDFTAEHAYVGQMQNYHARQHLCLVRDDHTVTYFTDDTLIHDAVELIHPAIFTEPRWTSESIETFRRQESEIIEKAQLFQKIGDILHAYIDLTDERFYDFLTLWNIGTYFCQLFNTYPYVYVGGISESGKSKLLTICSHICFNSILGSNMSTATIFRLIQNARCSLFIDETENLSRRYMAEEFRNLLLNGYKKGLKTYRTRRTEEGNFVPEAFEVYGPKMLANIEGIEDVLESRCIAITMRRSSNGEVTSREAAENNPVWQQIRDEVYPFLMSNWKAIRQVYSEFTNDTTLTNRDLELWKPMLVLAGFFDRDNLLPKMKNFAVEIVKRNRMDDSESQEHILVEALLQVVEHDDYYNVQEIKCEMANLVEDNAWLTERHVGTLLRRLGFDERRRVNGRYQYFLEVAEVEQIAKDLGILTVIELGGHSGLGEDTAAQGNDTQNTGDEQP